MSKKINKVRKQTIISALVGTILLVFGSVLYFLASGQKDLSAPQAIVVVAITTLGVVAFLFILYKKLKRNKHADKLKNDYEVVFEEIKEYIGISGLSFLEKRELEDEILSLFLEAQEDGKKINEVTGGDYKAFVDDMVKAYGVKNYLLYDLLTGVQYFIFYIIAVQLILYVEQMGKAGTSFFNVEVEYTLILFFIVSAFVAIPAIYYIKRRELQNYNSRSLLLRLGVVVAIFAGFIIIIKLIRQLLGHLHPVSIFLNEGTVIISSPFMLLLLLAVFGLIFYLKAKLRRL